MQEQDLAKRYADLSDEALCARLASGQLTELAQAVALAEAQRRGLHPQQYQAHPSTDGEPLATFVDFVQLSRYLQPMEAYILRGRLAAEGIDAHLSGAHTIETNPLWFNAMGGVRLFVRRDQCAKASEILAQRDDGDFALPDEAPASPGPAVHDAQKRRFGWIVLVMPALAFACYVLFEVWAPDCPFHSRCPASDRDTMSFYFMKLLASSLGAAPAVLAVRYLRLRFSTPSASVPRRAG